MWHPFPLANTTGAFCVGLQLKSFWAFRTALVVQPPLVSSTLCGTYQINIGQGQKVRYEEE